MAAYALPRTLDDAVAAIGAQPDALVVAGGTDLMVEVNDGRRHPPAIVAVRRVAELRARHVEGGELVVGAGTTYTELLAPDVAAAAPALSQAARTVGSPQIRNAGTIGGNLATASPAGDTLPVLVALDASVDVRSTAGARRLAVTDLLTGPKRTALEPGELLVAVRVPIVRGPQEYLKVGVRNAMVIAVASVAFVVDLDARRIGLGLGSVGPTALAARPAAEWLSGRLGWGEGGIALRDPGDLDRFGEMVAAEARPIDDHRSTAGYRRHAVGVLARRALRRALANRDGRT